MSRFLTFTLFSTLLILTSCGGGWSEEQKDQIKNKCIADGGFDCNCLVETVVKANANPEDYNNLSADDKSALVQDCVVEVEEEQEEELESF